MFQESRLADGKTNHLVSKGFLVTMGFDCLFSLYSVVIITIAAKVEDLLTARYCSKHFSYVFNPQHYP